MRTIQNAVGLTQRAQLARNNVGVTTTAPRISYGLGKGSADLIGFIFATGRFFAVEVKTPTGRLSKDQKNWINFVNKYGGYACVARSPDEALQHMVLAESGEKGPEV